MKWTSYKKEEWKSDLMIQMKEFSEGSSTRNTIQKILSKLHHKIFCLFFVYKDMEEEKTRL